MNYSKVIIISAFELELPRLTELFESKHLKAEFRSLEQGLSADECLESFFVTSAPSALPAHELQFLKSHSFIKNIIFINVDFDENEDVAHDFRKKHPDLKFFLYDDRVFSPGADRLFSPEQKEFMLSTMNFLSESLSVRSRCLCQIQELEEKESRIDFKLGKLEDDLSELNSTLRMDLKSRVLFEKKALYQNLNQARQEVFLRPLAVTPKHLNPFRLSLKSRQNVQFKILIGGFTLFAAAAGATWFMRESHLNFLPFLVSSLISAALFHWNSNKQFAEFECLFKEGEKLVGIVIHTHAETSQQLEKLQGYFYQTCRDLDEYQDLRVPTESEKLAGKLIERYTCEKKKAA